MCVWILISYQLITSVKVLEGRMITMTVFFNLFFFISIAWAQKLEEDNDRFPELFKISIEDPEFNESAGFYKKLQT